MNICFFCDSVFTFGGVQRVLAVIAKEMSKNHNVTIITLDDISLNKDDIYELNKTNIRIIHFKFVELSLCSLLSNKPYSWLYKTLQLKGHLASDIYAHSSFPAVQRNQLIRIFNSNNYDVIIGVHAFLSIKLATIRKHLKAKKIIGWMHNSYQAFFENKPSYLQDIERHFAYQLQQLDNVVVLSKNDAILFKEKQNINTTVIYNPITLTPGLPCLSNSRKMISIGRMSHLHKGFDILIKAFSVFAKKNSQWTLEIVGEGPEQKMLENIIKENNMEDRVTISPFTKDIQKKYSSASVYILSSRWEGMPLVLVEALSHGLTIISSDIPISKEILEDLNTTMFFRKNDIYDLAKKMEKISFVNLQNNVDTNIEYAKRFSCENAIKQWNDLLTQNQSK